ncbi:MAG: VOC family protein [Saccharofermentanales bacterium]
MKRSMMQMYVKNSAEAVAFYMKAFHATIGNDWRNPDGSCAHVELNAYGQILAISEATDDIVIGNNMQFGLHFEENEDDKVKHAYEVLKDGAEIVSPIGECPFGKCMFALIDRFGVNWCIFS